ncbi:MAG: SDR family oxidoreductase [Sporichthyaceae bacterium]|nr:SDR family oxidoreductase [Sporichthyaceae bacterium]
MAVIMMTGASGGIGSALVELLRERGDEVIPVTRQPEKLAWAAPRLVVADLARPETIAAAVAALGAARLDGLVHCAGVIGLGSVADTTAQSWAQQLTVNLAGPAELTRAVLPALRAGRGHVIFLNFWVGPLAKPGWSAYAASKFGLRALADALRGEEERYGVTVSSIYPGCVATELQRSVREGFGVAYEPEAYIQPATVARLILTTLDMPSDARLTDLTVGMAPAARHG